MSRMPQFKAARAEKSKTLKYLQAPCKRTKQQDVLLKFFIFIVFYVFNELYIRYCARGTKVRHKWKVS